MLKETPDGKYMMIDIEAYQSALAEARRRGDNKIRTILTFAEPKELYHGKRKGYVTAKKHKIKSLFWKGKKGQPFYIPTSHHTRGYSLGLKELELKNIEITGKQVDYSTQWRNIAKSMRKHNININIAEAIEAHLRGETEYIKAGLQNYYTIYDKPKKMSFKDVTGGLSIGEMKERMTKNQYGLGYYMNKPGTKRDRSVSLEKRGDRFVLNAASEYAGYGNGDYYVMYSPTMAFYANTD